MKYLFDASSIVNLVKKNFVEPFIKGATIELAFYESINAVWKEHVLLRHIEEKVAMELIEVLEDIFNVMKVLSMRSMGKEVFEIATKEKMTIYDASYLCAAVKNGLTLVSDDEKLRSVSSKYVNTITSKQLAIGQGKR
ncbi:MAG: DNA-binding protein [Candidatus Methanomethylicota archaeon]|uniref:DNA-binding protein n=1 Tax=Thermoproteota archaeon TaxID=2056631 RepID=A0A497ES93_9CREN|nr:MAG: DNA-binding protein [Candidatus Verstraetearchaeota archaeon]RLE53389.1 MAG: DNA-binding protein [Candidatus Verstraetearchaeota archaeon]